MSQPHGGFGPAIPPPAPTGGHPRWAAPLLIALSLAVLVSAGGLVWAIDQRLGPEPAAAEPAPPAPLPAEPIEATLAWQIPAPDTSSFDEEVREAGLWLHEDTVVRVMPDALVSYAVSDGSERWRMPLAAGRDSCTSSPRIDAGRIAVLSGMSCEHLIVVDLTSGEQQATIALGTTRMKAPYLQPAILGDTVAIGSWNGGAGFRISDGEQLWWHQPSGRCAETGFTVLEDRFVSRLECGTGCNDLGVCGYGHTGTGLRATTEDGEELWRWEFDYEVEGSRLDITGVISVEPLVIHVRLDGMFPGDERVFVVEDTRNSVLTEVGYEKNRHASPCSLQAPWWCGGALVGGDYLALSGMDAVGLSVFRLTTGELVGDVPADGATMRPIAMVEGELLVYRGERGEHPGALLAIDPETLAERTVMTLDANAAPEADMWGALGYDVRIAWDSRTRTLIMASAAFHTNAPRKETALLAYR
ncbi:outer membrane protein assembly factor BamB family protein [Streptomyces carpaticus]|uniref:PQQ-binding-like beta-propeller repeat protein n=1 Tax=Streptomyces carpaticus TaxID=285558 RepID=A0ABV4ZFW1_9ACTN